MSPLVPTLMAELVLLQDGKLIEQLVRSLVIHVDSPRMIGLRRRNKLKTAENAKLFVLVSEDKP